MRNVFITGLAVVLGTVMTLNLSSCGGDSSTSAEDNNSQNQESTETGNNSSPNINSDKNDSSTNTTKMNSSSSRNSSSNESTNSGSQSSTSVKVETAKGASFVDERDGRTYKTVQIGIQVWMAENMKLDVSDGFCYGDVKANCEKYGTFYNSNTALRVCPEGWRLPTANDWKILAGNIGTEKSDKYGGGTFVYNNDDAISKIRSKDGWKNSNGTNALGFSAYPAGYFNGTQYSGLGEKAYFMGKHTASEDDAWAYVSEKEIYVTGGKVTSAAMPVRCMQEIPCDEKNAGEVKGTVICRNGKWNEGSEIEIATNFKKCNKSNEGEVLNGYVCHTLIDGSWKWLEPSELEIAVDFKPCTADNEGEYRNGYICENYGDLRMRWHKATDAEIAVGFKVCNKENVGEIINGYTCSPCTTFALGVCSYAYNSVRGWLSVDSVVVNAQLDQAHKIYQHFYYSATDMSIDYVAYIYGCKSTCTWDEAMKSCPEGWHIPKNDTDEGNMTMSFNSGMNDYWKSTELDADSAYYSFGTDAKSKKHWGYCFKD